MLSMFESWDIKDENARLPYRYNIVFGNLRAFAVA
jgi:hypothetical protein